MPDALVVFINIIMFLIPLFDKISTTFYAHGNHGRILCVRIGGPGNALNLQGAGGIRGCGCEFEPDG